MALDVLQHATFTGPAFPEPFVRFELEKELSQRKLLPQTTGAAGRELEQSWGIYRQKLRELVAQGGAIRVRNHMLEPLVPRLGYERLEEAGEVETREGREPGGYLMTAADGARLRVWATALAEDLDAPSRRGRAYRYSHARIAQRVLLAGNERVGLLTNGLQLRILISDPARPDSQIEIPIDPYWKRSRDVPDTYRLLLALASPAGVQAVPDLVDKARLQQTHVTRELRVQARQAVERFIQEVLDHSLNRERLAAIPDRGRLARELWREGLVVVYRLLVILKLESSDDPARAFSFASSSLWRNSFSPTVALARHARAVLDAGAETGHLLEHGLRALFRMFTTGLECSELHVKPLGGALFGQGAAPILSELVWGEHAVAHLLDRLLWTSGRRGATARARVHYGTLGVEDLGRVYEALLELEPGIVAETMCRLRRQKLEVVVPAAQGERYRPARALAELGDGEETEEVEEAEDEEEEEAPARGKKTKVEWIEEIPPDRFYLRVGLGRKSTGSYYTSHSFVRFLVQETLGPLVAKCSPPDDPRPAEILKLKIIDLSMGSGHFLVETCRFLGEKLYEACRICDEWALEAERRAEKARGRDAEAASAEAHAWRQRIIDLPDPDDALLMYLPSRAPEGEESGLSQKRAEALCRRLVAVHCLYGVDKNPLAVELAKLSLWIESHAEGLPLTFLDHRLVVGDSLTGPFFEHLLTAPGSRESVEDLFRQGLTGRFTATLGDALGHVRDLEASVGVSLAEVEAKRVAKARLDRALAPFKLVAAAWAGGVMLGPEGCDDEAYRQLVKAVAETGSVPDALVGEKRLVAMILRGLGLEEVPTEVPGLADWPTSAGCIPALPFELTFPEVFYPQGRLGARQGFNAAMGNPPWERMLPADKEFFASYDFRVLEAPTKRERTDIEKRLLSDAAARERHDNYLAGYRAAERLAGRLYAFQVVVVEGEKTIGKQDAFRLFMERNAQLLGPSGLTGVVVPSAFHANEGATGIRRLYLEQMGLRCCYSFENRRKLFEIDSRFKFATVVASRQGPTVEFPCAFYLHDDEWLFGDRGDRQLRYTLNFVRRTGGDYLSLLELRSRADHQIAELCFQLGQPFGRTCGNSGLSFGRELNMTDDAWRFTPAWEVILSADGRAPQTAEHLLALGYLLLHEGKTFWHYDDRWEEPPRYLVSLAQLRDKQIYAQRARFLRLAYRTIASSTNERTAVFAVLPAGITCGHSVGIEQIPETRMTCHALVVCAMADSFTFDWCLRQMVGANVTQYQLFAAPLPRYSHIEGFCAHSALRLTCNHSGFVPLWREQLGDAWREPKPPFTWPVLAGDDERWAVRAAIDTVVADAYGLSREQYEHVLSTFSHKSYPKAPALCLACFDELKEIGQEAFTRKYDPYWDVPLNEKLSEPVIELPIPAIDSATSPGQLTLDFPAPEGRATGTKRRSRRPPN